MMARSPAGQSLFQPPEWVQKILARVGWSTGSRGASRRAAFLLGALVLVPPFVLSVWRGTAWGPAVDVPFLRDFDALARLLVVIPLLVLASRAIGVQLRVAMQYLERAAFVPDSARPDYQDAKLDVERRVRSSAVGPLLFIVVFAGTFLVLGVGGEASESARSSWMFDGTSGGTLSPAGWSYVLVSRPAVAFFLLLWAWRFVCWCVFLRRLGRMDLRILAAHPDLVGGLAPLVRAHTTFALVGIAVNVTLSGALANELLYGGATMAQIGPEVAFFTIISVLVLAAPLTVFVPGLLAAKDWGMVEYGRLGTDLTLDFDMRWKSGDAKLLDTADPSAMADFSADYGLVQQTKPFPLGLRQLAALGVALFLPFVALALTQVSLSQLLRSLVEKAL